MNKKSILTLATSAFVIGAPIATIVSCSSKTYDLKVGVRGEEIGMWEEVVKPFEEATGKSVKLIIVNDQQKDYGVWSASSSMPDVTIADSGATSAGIEKKWFQSIDLEDIITNKDYRVNTTGEWAEKDLQFNSTYFVKSMMDFNQNQDDNLYSAAAVIYGPKITYAWKKLPKKDGGTIEVYDGTKELKWYVPNATGNGNAEVAEFNTGDKNSSPLYSLLDGHRLKNTVADVQEFMSRSISDHDLKFNADSYSAASLTATDNKKRVIATGMPGYKQRLASIGKTLYDHVKDATSFELLSSVFGDNAIPYANIAFGKAQYQNTTAKVTQVGVNLNSKLKLDESKVFSGYSGIADDKYKIRTDSNISTDPTNMTELEVINYLSVFGLSEKGSTASSGIFPKKEDSQIGFAAGMTLLLPNGALWQRNGLFEKVKNKLDLKNDQEVYDYLTVFGQPIQETGVDGYAISSKTTGDRLTLAKKFLRFMFQTKAAKTITGSKAISVVNSAQAGQAAADELFQKAFNSGDRKWFTENNQTPIDGIPWVIAKSTFNSQAKNENDRSIYDIYNNYYMKGTEFDGANHFSPKTTLEKIKVYNSKFQSDRSINS